MRQQAEQDYAVSGFAKFVPGIAEILMAMPSLHCRSGCRLRGTPSDPGGSPHRR
jgi:hypothetical protein